MKKRYLRDLHDSDTVDNMKIDCQDYFELVYLRHRYFRNSTNPEPERLFEFEEMLCNISDKFFVKNYRVFNLVGFEKEDLRNIARVHTVSFISMGGLKENADKMEKFRKRHKDKYGQNSEPGLKDIFRKECYDLARFLNQRMQDIVRNAKTKNNNIRGTAHKDVYLIGNNPQEISDSKLANNPESYGYKKISKKRYKELEKENNAKGKKTFLSKNNETVRAIHIKGKNLSIFDIKNMGLDPRDSMYYEDPESNLIKTEKNK
jgi:hypothetical protein